MSRLVTLTGLTGFVGTNLASYLVERDFRIDSLNREQLSVDLDFKSADAVIHLAGKAHDLKKTSNPDEYYHVNFELTKRLYDAFLASDAKKFIFVSSVKAVADTVDGALLEDAIPNPQTHYGKSKLMAERYIESQPLPVDKTYYILRPCMIHGAGNKGNLTQLYNFVKKGVPYPLAAFENKRSFLSMQNLCFVIHKLLERDIPSGIYNIADDEALSTNDVVKILSQSIDKKARLWKIPSKWIQFAAMLGNKFRLPLNTERLNKLTENYVVSNNKIKKALSSELPVQSRNGLMHTAKSFKTS